MGNDKEYSIPIYVSLPISDVKQLDELADQRNCARQDLIREAVKEFLEKEAGT